MRRTTRNGYEHDIKAPDGFLLGGYRRVCKGGYIRFHSGKWAHPELKNHIDEYVFVHVDCCWATEASWTADHDKKWRTPLFGNTDGRKPLEQIP